jgi:hypothetical protein
VGTPYHGRGRSFFAPITGLAAPDLEMAGERIVPAPAWHAPAPTPGAGGVAVECSPCASVPSSFDPPLHFSGYSPAAEATPAYRLVAQLAEVSPTTTHWVAEHFGKLAGAMSTLRDMAARELRGEPFSDAQLAFINQAVVLAPAGCGSPEGTLNGWYAGLFLMPHTALQFDPVIADVHTQPTDDAGTAVGNVLHVGTGYPRLLVTTVDTCVGPRAYAGVVYAYHEQITTDFDRISDAQWAARLQLPARPADVRWLAGARAD